MKAFFFIVALLMVGCGLPVAPPEEVQQPQECPIPAERPCETRAECDDSNPCTWDFCNVQRRCAHKPFPDYSAGDPVMGEWCGKGKACLGGCCQ